MSISVAQLSIQLFGLGPGPRGRWTRTQSPTSLSPHDHPSPHVRVPAILPQLIIPRIQVVAGLGGEENDSLRRVLFEVLPPRRFNPCGRVRPCRLCWRLVEV